MNTMYLNDGIEVAYLVSTMEIISKPILFFFLFFLVLLAFPYKIFAAQTLILTQLSNLRPTQKNVGMIEVQRKIKRLQALPDEYYDQFLRDHPIPVVKGPKGRFYMIDHHHLGRALYETGAKVTYVFTYEDLSHLNHEQFWNAMIEKQFVFLKDQKGKVLLPAQLPKNIADLKDDPYRSLAGIVRTRGGDTKVIKPFSEFAWTHFFRKNKLLHEFKSTSYFESAVKKALELSQTYAAHDLPGYQTRCENIFLEKI